VIVTDIVTRLRRWTHAVDAAPASDLMDEAAEEIENLRTAIRRLADQDATLSVCDGAVTVTMDGTLTDEERRGTNMTTQNDANEPSPASAGSHGEPVAWAVWSPSFGYPFGDAAIFKRNEMAVEMCVMNGYGVDDIIPLYRKPMLADEELKAIRRAAAADWKAACESAEAASKEFTRLKLTRYERHCIERVRDTYADEDDVECNEIAAILDGLLERTK